MNFRAGKIYVYVGTNTVNEQCVADKLCVTIKQWRYSTTSIVIYNQDKLVYLSSFYSRSNKDYLLINFIRIKDLQPIADCVSLFECDEYAELVTP
jgi:hypothetical protein